MAWAEEQFHRCLVRAPEAESARRYFESRGIDAMNRDMDALAGEPGTEAFIVAVDPDEDDIVWLYEWFRDADALDAHRASAPFHEMMRELPAALAAPPALIRIDPLRMHLQRSVAEGRTVDRIF